MCKLKHTHTPQANYYYTISSPKRIFLFWETALHARWGCPKMPFSLTVSLAQEAAWKKLNIRSSYCSLQDSACQIIKYLDKHTQSMQMQNPHWLYKSKVSLSEMTNLDKCSLPWCFVSLFFLIYLFSFQSLLGFFVCLFACFLIYMSSSSKIL